ncbi:MAG: ABC transporter permease subunit [bacterium]
MIDVTALSSWPVLAREVRGFLRSRKAFACLFLFLSVLLLFLLLGWRYFTRAFSQEEARAGLAIAGKMLFRELAFGQILVLTVLTPFLTAPAIAGESERGTLALLVSSPVSLSLILVQKLVSSMAFLILLLMGAMPVMAFCFVAGGLSGQEVAGAYLTILGASCMYGSIGLACSTFSRQVYKVYLLTFLLILLVAFVLPFHSSIWHYITRMAWKSGTGATADWDWLSPFAVLQDLLFPESGVAYSTIRLPLMGNVTLPRPSLPLFLLLNATICVVCLVAARWRMRGVVEGPGLRGGMDGTWSDTTSLRDEMANPQGLAVKSGMFDDDRNPAILLEQRIQWLGRVHVILRLLYLALMLSVLTLPFASSKGAWIFFSLPFLAAALFTVPLAATSISSERERNTLDMSLVTLLSPSEILQAKYRTSFISSLILALALYLPGMFVVLGFGLGGFKLDLLVEWSDALAIIAYPFLLVSALSFYTALSLYCSVKCRHSNAALLVSAIAILGCITVPLFVVHLLSTSLSLDRVTAESGGFIGVALSTLSFGKIVFVLISPLTIVSTLFTQGTINLTGFHLDHPLSSVEEIGFFFVVTHCVLVISLARWLLHRSAVELADSTGSPIRE